MRDYILRRLILLIPIMFGVTFLTFLAYRVIPGNAAVLTCGLDCSPQVIKDLEHEYGLDRPWYEQYVGWLWDVAHGDLGRSFAYKIPVTTELGRRVPITVELLVLTLVLGVGQRVYSNGMVEGIARVVGCLAACTQVRDHADCDCDRASNRGPSGRRGHRRVALQPQWHGEVYSRGDHPARYLCRSERDSALRSQLRHGEPFG